MVSKLLTPEDLRHQCELFFPEVNGFKVGVATGRQASDIVARTGGWTETNTTRLMWSNGEHDPWRGATVSSPWRPGGMLASTPEAPVHLIPGAAHCTDLAYGNTEVNADSKRVWDEQVAQMEKWVGEFYTEKKLAWPLHNNVGSF